MPAEQLALDMKPLEKCFISITQHFTPIPKLEWTLCLPVDKLTNSKFDSLIHIKIPRKKWGSLTHDLPK